MKSRAILLGHPLHPMLIPFPIGFLAGAVVFDIAGRVRGEAAWWATGGHLLLLGIGAALLAAVPGLIDYVYTVPPASSARTRATKHMASNLSAVGLFAIAWVSRGPAAAPPPLPVLGVEALAVLVLGFGGYLGGTLVTRNLIGVDHRYAQAGKWSETTIEARTGTSISVARRDELKVDQMKLIRAGAERIVLARTEGGYVAFDDRCTHRGGSLAGGVMMCGTVQCLWHGSQFDAATGRVKGGPAQKPIRVYQVREEGNEIKLAL